MGAMMRDSKRIRPNWQKIAEIHEHFPDWRMGQFMFNVLSLFREDPYFLEDDEFIDKIREMLGIEGSSKLTDK